ncbi:MAG: hypothetical protein WC728_17795 [Elusimicrobiota bacterium]
MRGTAFLLLCAGLAAAPAWAAKVPKVGSGSAVATDRYVQEYADTMKSVESQINAIKAALAAMPEPTGRAAGIAAEAQVMATYAPIVGLMSKAEAAQMKMYKHILGADGSLDQEFDVMLGLPPFESKRDDPNLTPHEDGIFEGEPDAKPSLQTDPSPFGTPTQQQQGGAAGPAQEPPDSVDEQVGAVRERMKQRQEAVKRFVEEARKTAAAPQPKAED